MLNTPFDQYKENDYATSIENLTNEYLKQYFRTYLQELPREYNDASNKLYIIWEFYCDLYLLVYEYVPAIANRNFEYAIDIIEKFYHVWIKSNTLSSAADSQFEQYMGMILASLTTAALSVQVMWATQYSLPLSYGLTLLTIAIGVTVTRPDYVSVGILNSGFFKFRVIKTHALLRNTLPLFYR